MADILDNGFDSRAYYGAILADHRATTFMALSSLAKSVSQRRARARIDGAWTVTEAEIRTGSPYALSERRRDEQRRGSGMYGYTLYHAAPPGDAPPWAFVATPYVRALHQLHADIAHDDSPAIQYLKFDMVNLYAQLERDKRFRCQQVEVQMESPEEVETVVLAGRRPLDSRIHRMIKDETVPYGARIASTREEAGRRPAPVTLERFGNIRWHMSGEHRLVCALWVLGDLIESGYTLPTTDFPGARIDPEHPS